MKLAVVHHCIREKSEQACPACARAGAATKKGRSLAKGLLPLALSLVLLASACKPSSPPATSQATATNSPPVPELRGEPIVPLAKSNPASILPSPSQAASLGGSTNRLSMIAPPPPGIDTNQVLNLSFDTLSAFDYNARMEMDPETQKAGMVSDDVIPPPILAWDGRRVAVTGYVMPVRTQGRGVTQFLLARDQLSCCFGPSAQMNHWIDVKMPRGKFRPRIFLPATVVGTLQVGELRKNGSLQSIYRMDAEEVVVSKEGSESGLPGKS